MITLEYIGEYLDGTPHCNCASRVGQTVITKKKIFGDIWEVGRPKQVSLLVFDKYMATELFRIV
ncbi:hypothetical protein BG262_02845 [Floricoccus penangensis]|uniref:Uncharacterized protein n=1 Tax=Floricoccus penangensis TaxID=1859475 RepID=A0A9Q5JGY3_9LACT|nr:hypothetical protein BG262_02845 [Floricoccus penangensis]